MKYAHNSNVCSINTKSSSIWQLLMLALSCLFFLGIIWINFHSYRWYNCDMYPDAYVAKLMYEQKTLFPEGFVFANQYYGFATPTVAAVMNTFTTNMIDAMALASSFMTVIILFAFIWCLKPFVKRDSIIAGILCIIGGTVFGIRASLFEGGMKFLYTMCSFYSCYLIVLLLSTGCWLRIRLGNRPILGIIITFILSFLIGINSAREMLICNIPLFLVALIDSLNRCGKKWYQDKGFLLSALLLLANGLGMLLSRIVPPTHYFIIPYNHSLTPSILLSRFWGSIYCFLDISGVLLFKRGLKAFPLFICAVLVFGIVLFALFRILLRNHDKKDNSLGVLILLCHLSIWGVVCAGTFILDTRSVYFFVYYFLAALSVVYLFENAEKMTTKSFFSATLLGIASISFIYQFLNDFKEYHYDNLEISDTVNELIAEGYEYVFNEGTAIPCIAAYSNERMKSVFIRYDFKNETNSFFHPSPFFIPYSEFKEAPLNKCILAISGWEFKLIQSCSPPNGSLFDHIDLIKEIKNQNNSEKDLYLYRILDNSVIGEPYFN